MYLCILKTKGTRYERKKKEGRKEGRGRGEREKKKERKKVYSGRKKQRSESFLKFLLAYISCVEGHCYTHNVS
jgi:uncharacterized protein (DUF927 family)